MLITKEVKSAADPCFARLYEIYARSLPKREQKTRAEIEALVARPDYLILAVEDDGTVVSFAIVHLSPSAPIALLEYMATDPARRNGGIGAHVFAEVARKAGGRFILVEADSEREGDAHDLAMRVRRKAFYRRVGCRQLDALPYILPLPGEGDPPLMDLLICADPLPQSVAVQEVRRWLAAIYSDVYGQSVDDPRIERMLASLQGPVIFVR